MHGHPFALSAWTALQRVRTEIAAWRAYLRSVARRHHVHRLHGLLRGRTPVVVAYTGDPDRLEELRFFLFQGEATVEDGPGPADLLVWDASPRSRSRGDVHVASPWLDACATPGPDLDRFIIEHGADKLRYDLRRAHKAGFDLDVSFDPGDVERFYHEQLVPLVSGRHGRAAQVPPLRALLKWQTRGTRLEQLYLKKDGKRVAGATLAECPGEKMLRLLAYGALPEVAQDNKLRGDAIIRLTEQAFLRASARGFSVNLGLTRPFRDDGVLLNKRRWGARLRPVQGMSRYAIELGAERRGELSNCLALIDVEAGRVSGTARPETRTSRQSVPTSVSRPGFVE